MKLVIGGTISILLSIFGFVKFFPDFLNLIKGILPWILIIGGILTIMLKREEDAFDSTQSEPSFSAAPETTEPEITEAKTTEPEEADAGLKEIKAIEPELTEKNLPDIESMEKIGPTTDGQPETAVPEEETADQVIEVVSSGFIGNESSFVFHTLNCQYSTSKKCTQQFETREQAIENNYKPCNICKP